MPISVVIDYWGSSKSTSAKRHVAVLSQLGRHSEPFSQQQLVEAATRLFEQCGSVRHLRDTQATQPSQHAAVKVTSGPLQENVGEDPWSREGGEAPR